MNINKYILCSDYVKVYDNNNNYFLIDKEDLEKIKGIYWRVNIKSGYVETRKKLETGIFLHRYLINPEKEMTIDHINHIKTDNRKSNLEDAIIARLKAEKEYFGEYAPQKHLFDKYGI